MPTTNSVAASSIGRVRARIDYGAVFKPWKRPLNPWILVGFALVIVAVFDIVLFVRYSKILAPWLRSLSSLGSTIGVNTFSNGLIELKKAYNASKIVIHDLEEIVIDIHELTTDSLPKASASATTLVPNTNALVQQSKAKCMPLFISRTTRTQPSTAGTPNSAPQGVVENNPALRP